MALYLQMTESLWFIRLPLNLPVLEDIAWKLTVTVQIIWLYFFPPCISQSERVANFVKLIAVNYILSSVLIL